MSRRTVPDSTVPSAQAMISHEHIHTRHPTTTSSQDLSQSEADAALLRLEVASYIGQMTAELAAMARGSELGLLSYFLDMATAEAREAASKLGFTLHASAPMSPLDDQALT